MDEIMNSRFEDIRLIVLDSSYVFFSWVIPELYSFKLTKRIGVFMARDLSMNISITYETKSES